jgi:hypothetical protein
VIAWVSVKPGVGLVEYGETPRLGREEIDTRVGRRHAVALSGLDPGSTYHYQVAGDEGGSETGRLHTAPEGEDSRFVFAVIGDSGRGRKQQLAVAALLERMAPDLILHTGDVVYPSGEDRHYDRRFFAPYRRLLREVPVFPVLGNHDIERANGAAYLANFHPPRNDPRGTGRYYSFDWGNAHFVALDSELYTGTTAAARKSRRPGWSATWRRPPSAGRSRTCTGRSTAPPSTAATRRYAKTSNRYSSAAEWIWSSVGTTTPTSARCRSGA